MDSIVVILLAMLIYLPGTTMGSLVRIGVVLCAYVITPRKARFGNEREISRITLCMVVSPFIPLIFVAMSGGINTATVAHEVMRMIYCALLILTVSKLYISFNTIYFATLVAFIPNLAIQIMEYLKNPWIFNIIRQYYVLDEYNLVHFSLAFNSGAEFRSGSVFINPNVYMIIPLLALCVFFYKDRTKPSIMNIALIVAVAVSGLLTGSRTSIVVMAVIMAVYYMRYSTGSSKFVAILLITVIAVRYGASLMGSSRALQITNTDSLDTKYLSFLWYWHSTSSTPYLWLTGSLGSRIAAGMDAEWGHIYAWFGLFGLYWYIKYYKVIWRNNAGIVFFSKIVMIACAMVSMTASVLLCMPVYSYAGLIAFSHLKESEYGLRY